jgi:hypothetical protein
MSMPRSTQGGASAPLTLRQRLVAFWREIEPGLSVTHDSNVERWDGNGEGRATCIDFEGFGLSFALFIGRTPPAHKEDR